MKEVSEDLKKRLLSLILFSLAFGFVEATVVIYLRDLLRFNSVSSINTSPLLNLGIIAFLPDHSITQLNNRYGQIEVWREFSTIVMLWAVTYLAGSNLRQRLGSFLIAFSLWDLSYYLFLYLLINWPTSFSDLDIYFLIPVPWVGPVITPVVASTLMLIFGLKYFLERN